MDTLEVIKTRRSIRKYKDEAISDNILKELLEAGMSGPTGGNNRPWEFIIINDHEILRKIPDAPSGASFAPDAPLAILVCGDLEKYSGLPEKYLDVWVIDCSIAAQNILLAAHGKDLGAVWTGVYPMEERVNGIKTLLELPKNIIPLVLIVIGYPAEQLPVEDRYDASRVHYNKF
ncbi:MAG: nitroreductase family protein [Methanobacterium sp.]